MRSLKLPKRLLVGNPHMHQLVCDDFVESTIINIRTYPNAMRPVVVET